MEEFRLAFPRTSGVIDAGITQGLHSGAQLYISLKGSVAAEVGVGQSRPGVNMTPLTILLWLSSGKPLAVVAVAQLWQAGLLELDDPVARHLPEFGGKGKEAITLRHLLTHTGGFRWADYQHSMPWEMIISRICAAPLEPRWIPGRTAGYHAFTSWYILGEVIRRLDPSHRPYEKYVDEEIFQPLGMADCALSLSPEQVERHGDRIGLLHSTGIMHGRQLNLDQVASAGWCVPGASARGPARGLGRFYEMLLNRGKTSDGNSAAAILWPQTVESLSARHRTGLHDLTFKQIVDWGLGLIVNSAIYGEEKVPYGLGRYASPRAFGHGGSQSSVGMADPENQLVVAVIFNGMPGEIAHHQRIRSTLSAIYEDLGLG